MYSQAGAWEQGISLNLMAVTQRRVSLPLDGRFPLQIILHQQQALH